MYLSMCTLLFMLFTNFFGRFFQALRYLFLFYQFLVITYFLLFLYYILTFYFTCRTVPLSVTHATLVDTELMGYNILKKTFVVPNLYSIHLDPNHWEEPTKFNPDRFIDASGKILKKDAFMPFSIGKTLQCCIFIVVQDAFTDKFSF